MIMKGEKEAREVVKFFRSQPQEEGVFRLLGIKVELMLYNSNAYEASEYIEKNYPLYTAHAKDSKNTLSVGYRSLRPFDDEVSKSNNEMAMAKMLISFLKSQKWQGEGMKLVSIKVILPEWANSEKISAYIAKKYPKEYKVHEKHQGEYPIVAIGYQK